MKSARAWLCIGLLAALLAGLLGGCAWADRDNRPVWNAFEEHLVPDGDTAFWATLPVTVPGGFVAILLDTFLVHPAQVVDDAWGDTRDLWHGLQWRDAYYTELVVLPFRVVLTPVAFVCIFLGRSAFDVPPYEPPRTPEEEQAHKADVQARLADNMLTWMAALARGESAPFKGAAPDASGWTPPLQQGYDTARQQANAAGRLELYRAVRQHKLPPWNADRGAPLRDPDPVVRYLMLQEWPAETAVPPEARRALREDPNDLVRRLARERWRD